MAPDSDSRGGFGDVGFLSNLSTWVGEKHAQFSEQFQVAAALNRLAMYVLPKLPVSGPLAENVEAAYLAFGRGVQTYQCTLLLSEIGALADARTLARSLAETAIMFGGLLRVPGTYERLIVSQEWHGRRFAEAVLGLEGLTPEQSAPFQAAVDAQRVRGRAAPSVNWEQLAKSADMELMYIHCYRLPSGDSAHATAGALDRHRAPPLADGTPRFHFMPDDTDLEETLFIATTPVLAMLDLCTKELGMTSIAPETIALSRMWDKAFPK